MKDANTSPRLLPGEYTLTVQAWRWGVVRDDGVDGTVAVTLSSPRTR